MRIDIVETEVFEFSELSETAKQSAIDKAREFACEDSFWHDCVLDDAKATAKILGIDIQDIYFSGFWSQGDGAQFTGSYSYAKQSAKDIRVEYPKDETLHAIADGLRDIQRLSFYQLSASVSSTGHYSHEMCTRIFVYDDRPHAARDVSEHVEQTVTELLRGFMRWIYSRLQAEYEFQTSDDTLREWLQDSEQDFTIEGSIY